jgi:hypothetical protein
MKVEADSRLRPLAAALVAVLAAACAAPAPPVAGNDVTVIPVERAGYDRPPEQGLFRISFEAERVQRIRRESEAVVVPAGVDTYRAELWVFEREAEKELKARGLCSGNVNILTVYEEGGNSSRVSGLFKCRGPLF